MRIALAACLAAAAGCGDNAPTCGHVDIIDANRNIWGGQIAVDDRFVYYSDYDNGAGTHLLFRQLREGGDRLVIGSRGVTSMLGYGMASDGRYVYWTAEVEPTGYHLLATPALGGRTLDLTAISACTAHGVAVDDVHAYAGSICCDGLPSHVVAAAHDGSGVREIWSSADADVSSIAGDRGDAYIATTAGLWRVSAAGSELLDGRPTYHVVVDGDELVYSTEERILARPLAGGFPRTLYTFTTPITQPRAFAADAGDLYVSEPPRMIFVPREGEPEPLVRDMGAAITHMAARDGVAYWSTLAVPASLGVPGTYSGGVFRVVRPCR
jgi:hypothetical protein